MRKLASLRTIVLLIALCAAFGAGMAVTSLVADGGKGSGSSRPLSDSDRREIFSPDLRSDPHFLGEQRRNIETLQRHCADSGNMCAEARAARIAYEKLREES
ncbi:MAG: hypothetical protein MK010_05155 [Erythrobacter sp.]|nr:hypothetical protein [Erythrobacter sp.]